MAFDFMSGVVAAIGTFFKTGNVYAAAAAFVIGGFVGGDSKRSAKNKARSAFNDAQKSRSQMVRSATEPHKIVYGRALTSGPIAYAQSTGTKGEFMHLIVLLAAHECDAIETVYFNDLVLPAEDGTTGLVNTGETSLVEVRTATEYATGSSITLTHTPRSITAVTLKGFRSSSGASVTYTQSGSVITFVSDTTSAQKAVVYEYDVPVQATVRVRKFLGTATQAAASELISEAGGKWTSADQLKGRCYLYVRIEYRQEIYGQIGLPNVRAVVRGRKVYDPRKDSTAGGSGAHRLATPSTWEWSENTALCAADYLYSYMQATAAELPATEIAAEAAICDQTVATTGSTTEKRYTCNGVLTLDTVPRDLLESILDTMAGTCVWVQGRYLLRAGAHRSSVLTIDENLLAGTVPQILPNRPRSELINRVVPKYVEPAKTYTTVEATAVTNATYVAQDNGIDLPLDLDLSMVTGQLRAQRLGKIALERNRAGMQVQVTCNLKAYDVAPTDVVSLTLSRYGWSAKLFVVQERRFDLARMQVSLTLRETASTVWDWAYGEATAIDLTPNTSLPNPFTPPQALSGLSVASGTAHLILGADGTIITRGYVTWTQSTDVFVIRGGRIEVQSMRADGAAATDWVRHPDASGDATSAYIAPLEDQILTLVRVRAVNSIGRPGQWSNFLFLPLGKSQVPSNVSGASYVPISGGARVKWALSSDLDRSATEWRVGASYAAGTKVYRGAGTEFDWTGLVVGSYQLWGVAYDTTGNASTTPTGLTVLVQPVGSEAMGFGALTPFSPVMWWEFNATAAGWTATGASITTGTSSITLASSGTDPILLGPTGASFAGQLYTKVRARVRRLAGSGWQGDLFYSTAGHGFSGSYYERIATDPTTGGAWTIIEWDMASLTVGGTDWATNTVTQIRLDLGTTSSDQFEVDWIAVGRESAAVQDGSIVTESIAALAAAELIAATVDDDVWTVPSGSTAQQRILCSVGWQNPTSASVLVEVSFTGFRVLTTPSSPSSSLDAYHFMRVYINGTFSQNFPPATDNPEDITGMTLSSRRAFSQSYIRTISVPAGATISVESVMAVTANSFTSAQLHSQGLTTRLTAVKR